MKTRKYVTKRKGKTIKPIDWYSTNQETKCTARKEWMNEWMIFRVWHYLQEQAERDETIVSSQNEHSQKIVMQ